MTEHGSGNGVWLRWVVGLLCAIIVMLLGAWGNNVSGNISDTQRDVNIINQRLTRIETALDIPPMKKQE
jgi:hypothetical protein